MPIAMIGEKLSHAEKGDRGTKWIATRVNGIFSFLECWSVTLEILVYLQALWGAASYFVVV
jgi:hypothetical protein